jgi:hypothetical protein
VPLQRGSELSEWNQFLRQKLHEFLAVGAELVFPVAHHSRYQSHETLGGNHLLPRLEE